MKTLTDFKRRLTKGTLVHAYHNEYNQDMGTRPVSIVQSNAVAFRTDKGTDSWLYFPKASLFRVLGPDTAAILDEQTGAPLITYTFIGY